MDRSPSPESVSIQFASCPQGTVPKLTAFRSRYSLIQHDGLLCFLNIISIGIEKFKAALSDRIAVQKFALG